MGGGINEGFDVLEKYKLSFLTVSVYQGLEMTWNEVVCTKAADCI